MTWALTETPSLRDILNVASVEDSVEDLGLVLNNFIKQLDVAVLRKRH